MTTHQNAATTYAAMEAEDTSYQRAMVDLAMWETSPDRWKDDPETLPDQAPDVAEQSYHGHALPFLTMFWTRCEFSPRFQIVLNRLHGVLAKDNDPRALQMTVVEDGQTLSREQIVSEDGTVVHPRGAELEKLLWSKIDVLLLMVADHLQERGELTAADRILVQEHLNE